MADFVHLHVHTLFSLLEGAIRLEPLMERVKAGGMDAVAMTDTANLFGAVRFQKTAKAAGIKPIFGAECFVETGHPERPEAHLVLLAKDMGGYRNLSDLLSLAHLEGWQHGGKHPRITKKQLAAHAEGLFALSACLMGEPSQHLVAGDPDAARAAAAEYRDLFAPGHYHLELQHNAHPDQRRVNDTFKELSRDLKIPLVATGDCHYLDRREARAHDALIAIQRQLPVDELRKQRPVGDHQYVRSMEEMLELFEDVPDAVYRSAEIAERCDVELKLGEVYLPTFEVPEGFDLDGWLRKAARDGLERRFKELSAHYEVDRDAYMQRLELELDVIIGMGFAGYFLIVQEFIIWAKDHGIPVGPGRGSGAGSLVAYALRITDMDPIHLGLLFERFLNPERVSMPDFDVDFCMNRRDEVIAHVSEKYGAANVGQIITFGQLKARSVIRDVARVMRLPVAEADRIAKLVPEQSKNLPEALKLEPRLQELYEDRERPLYRELLDVAMSLEGLNRQAGMHAAGVVIGDKPLREYVPLYRGNDGEVVTQFDKDDVEQAGLVKFDFLGLKTLTVIEHAVRLVNRDRAPDDAIDIETIPLDDPKVYGLISRGDTTGVFQFESSGFKELLKKLKPDRFDDIVAAGALYRPGPLQSGMVDDYIARKHGRAKVTYPHESLEPILSETYGTIVYQEQVMRIAQVLAGYSLGRADELRRAMGKKKAAAMAAERPGFIAGAVERGAESKRAEEIFDLMAKFAEYGFNKCVIGETEIVDARTGERTTVGSLFESRRPFMVHALSDDGVLRPRDVTDVVWNGRKRTYRLKTELGHEIVATGNHPFRTLDGWTKLAELKAGDRVGVPRRLAVPAETTWPEHTLITLAGLISEGNTCHPTTLYFYGNDPVLVDDFAQAASRFERTVARVASRRDGRLEVAVNTGRDLRFAPGQVPWNAGGGALARKPARRVRSGAFEWAESLGLIGCKATEKFVPAPVFGLCDEDVALFLGRLWAGDGFIANATQAVPFYATSSRRLARDVQFLLLRLGIVGRIHEKRFRYRGGHRDGFTVHLLGETSVETFADRVLLHCVGRDRQIQKLREHLKQTARGRTRKDTIPAEVRRWVDEARRDAGLTWRALEAQSGVSAKEFYGNGSAGKRGFRRSTIDRLARFLGCRRLATVARSDVFWDRVVSIVPAGIADTYDLTVDVDHNFVADGLIVHNSHSAAYGLITYQTAWLKTHHPVEFMAAMLTSEKDATDKLVAHIGEVRRDMGIEVLPPDVNDSELAFDVAPPEKEGGRKRLRFGLGAVKGAGESAIEAILEVRAEGRFRGLYDFCERVDLRRVNRKTIEVLVAAGCFDFVGVPRPRLARNVERAMERGAKAARDRAAGQSDLFGALGGGGGKRDAAAWALERPEIYGEDDGEEWTERELLAREKEALGFYISGHPLDRHAAELARWATPCQVVRGYDRWQDVTIGGVVTGLRERMTKKGSRMAMFSIEDLGGTIECLCFSEAFLEHEALIKGDDPVLVHGKARPEGDEEKVVRVRVDRMERLEDVREREANLLTITVPPAAVTRARIGRLKNLFEAHPGRCRTYLKVREPDRWEAVVRMDAATVRPADELLAAVDRLFGGRVTHVT